MSKPENTVFLGEDPDGAPKFLSSEGASRVHELVKVDEVQHNKIARKLKEVYGSSVIDGAFRKGTAEKEILKAQERSKRPKLDTVDPDVPSGGKRRRLGRSQKRYNVSGHYTKRRGNKKRNTKRRGLSRRRRGTHRK